MIASAAAVLAITLVAAACSAGHADPGAGTLAPDKNLPSDTQDQLTGAVDDAMAATGASGAIVGVWAPWSGSWVAGLGTVEPDGKTAVTPEMTFRAGQLTRPMICDVLYALADDHVVALGDSITKYVGGMPRFADVTLESLCDGTSGIGSYNALLKSQSLGNPDRVWDPRELVGYGIGQVGGEVRTGVTYRDSDAGYVLLGLALERASGKSAAELLREHVFDPLGMDSTALPDPAAAAPVVGSSTALPGYYLGKTSKSGAYVCDKQTDITEQSASFGFTDAGVVSDISDLGSYARALARGTLVSDKSRFADALPVTASSPSWFTTAGGAVQAGPMVGQYGSTAGYLTAAFSDPKSGLTVAVVLNNSTAGRGPIVDLARELAAIASKAPATGDREAPALGLPWSADQFHSTIAKAAVCPVPRS
ncbi:serine hydrolase domain-containing protein [Microbacterium elymi]|uniref:Beta-lactamase family protein n=1 Tax=Microbacterium elymi TaxID=2909587 RepID=A0ABY5NMF3_9MICO|nr:serine hydrolase domain-containing protein [Microbacterium elymi]UUT36332.1 beta-lactamase family protein [Microbacterium elymi]